MRNSHDESVSAKHNPVPTVDLSKIPDDMTLSEDLFITSKIDYLICISADISDHLADLIVVLKPTNCMWFDLGLQLGLDYFDLEEIKKNNRDVVGDCMRNMLAEWLKIGKGCTRQTLETALLKIDCEIVSSCVLLVIKSISLNFLGKDFSRARFTNISNITALAL